MELLQESEKGGEAKIRKEQKELRERTVRKIREHAGKSCKLFWTDLRGKRKQRRLNRMKYEEGRIVKGEDMLEVMTRHWEELGRSSEDYPVPDTAMGDVGGCELGMCNEVSWVCAMK